MKSRLIPPEDAPPSEWSRENYRVVPGLIGAAVGLAIGVVGYFLGATPWLWLLAPLGLAVGWAGRDANTPARWWS